MYLYYNSENENVSQPRVLMDFSTLKEQLEHILPESTLYRILRHNCHPYRYRNRSLYDFEELMRIPGIAKNLKLNCREELL